MLRKTRRFFSIPFEQKVLFLEAALWLSVAQMSILTMPFRWIALALGKERAESPSMVPSKTEDRVSLISFAVRRASCHLPWECKCLAQAIAGKMMLKLRGISSTLYLGVAKDDEKAMVAHAWLRCGCTILLGERRADRFTVVGTFSETNQ